MRYLPHPDTKGRRLMPENSTQRERTTVGVWRTTVELLDRICVVNRRTRPEQVDFFCALEAERLGIETKEEAEPT